MFTITVLIIFIALTQCNQIASSDAPLKENVSVPYYVRVGDESYFSYNISVAVPKDSNFYSVMQEAARISPSNYYFEATVHPEFGHYITSIGLNSENKEKNIYWMLYVTNYPPNNNHPSPTDKELSDFGVDSLIVEEGLYYLFWRKHVELH